MAQVIALDEAKVNQVTLKGGRNTTGEVTVFPFFGSRNNPDPDLPLATLNQLGPGSFSATHFHIVDQFQVIVKGKGKLGRHDLAPYNVHFTRAYTPYGPLVSGADEGLTFFAMRAHYDLGGQRLSDNLERLRQVPNRQPWQVTQPAVFPSLQSGNGTAEVMLQEMSHIKDDQGLAAYTLAMKPNAHCSAPDSSRGDGQYLVVLKGSLLHDGKEHKAPALVFVNSKEGPFHIHSGPLGLEGLVLNFPQVKPRAVQTKTASDAAGKKKWQCTLCAFAYDEQKGMPDEGIPPGTRWQDVPDTWNCPDCAASKSDFQMVAV